MAEDRWQRRDWWGVVLDTDDVATLAHFYAELRGWPIWQIDESGAALDLGDGVAYLAVQYNPDHVRPAWPAPVGGQQMQLHLDFEVADLIGETARAIALGAVLAERQPQDDVRVLMDPAGHPFCLYVSS